MHVRKDLGTPTAACLLAALLLVVAALALRWVFLVPIYQAPDEPYHLDYALAIYQKGGLFRIQGPPPGARMVHPYTHYLMDRAAKQALTFHPDVKAPPGYGTASFYQTLAAECPSPAAGGVPEATGLAWVYPFGYYALLAGWITLLSGWSGSVVVLFFGARILSVLLLMISLLCVYGTAREMGFSRAFSLALVGIIGLFPMTLFVASYVQPDNLSFTLVSLCLYLTLVARRRGGSALLLAFLGIALGALLVTKGHYYLCTLAATLAALGAGAKDATNVKDNKGSAGRWIRAGVLLMAPSLALGSLYLWTIWGATTYYSGTAAHEHLLLFVLRGLHKALQDFYTGTTHRSFWGIFGWMDTPLVIVNSSISAVVHALLRLGTWTVLVLTLVRVKQVLVRVTGWLRRGKRRPAVRVLAANPVLNSFFLFTVLMVVLYVRLANRFGAQGRNWLPYLLPIFLTGLWYAPRALRRPRHRTVFTSVILAWLALYGVVGNYYAFQTLQARFYDPHHDQPMEQVPIPVAEGRRGSTGSPADGGAEPFQVFAFDKPAYVYAVRVRYTLAKLPKDTILFQSFQRQRAANASGVVHELSLDPLPQPPESTLYFWVNDTIDEWGIRAAGVEGPWTLREVVFYRQPETAPNNEPPSPGSHSVPGPRLVQWQDEH